MATFFPKIKSERIEAEFSEFQRREAFKPAKIFYPTILAVGIIVTIMASSAEDGDEDALVKKI